MIGVSGHNDDPLILTINYVIVSEITTVIDKLWDEKGDEARASVIVKITYVLYLYVLELEINSLLGAFYKRVHTKLIVTIKIYSILYTVGLYNPPYNITANNGGLLYNKKQYRFKMRRFHNNTDSKRLNAKLPERIRVHTSFNTASYKVKRRDYLTEIIRQVMITA